MQHILFKNGNEANKRRENIIETQSVKSKDWKGKRAATQKRREEHGKHTENRSASHLEWARGLMNYLIAYPPNPSPLHPVVSLLYRIG